MRNVLIVALVLVGAAWAQSDNRYCNTDNTWKGTSATNPVLKDGPAALPMTCYNTDPDNTPSPGNVIAVAPGQSLSDAYAAAKCGDVLELAHGATYNGPFTFPAKNCDDQHYVTIRTDGVITAPGHRVNPNYVPQMANLNMTQIGGFTQVGDHIRFVGLYISKGKPGIFYFLPALLKDANKIIFDRVYVHCNPREECQHGITINTGKFIAVIDSYMDEFHCIARTGTCVDSQAISGGTSNTPGVMDSGPVKIVNNFLEASTENILFGGAAADGSGPNDVEIRRNYLFKPAEWNPSDPNYIGIAYIVKNCFEIKNGSRMLIEGNVCQNNWGGYTQRGHAVLLTPKNQAGANGANFCPNCEDNDITFRYNAIHNAGGFMTIASATNDNGAYSKGLSRVSVHDNIADGLMYPGCFQCGITLMLIGSAYGGPTNPPPEGSELSDVSIHNNTIVAIVDSTFSGSAFNISGPPPGLPTVAQAFNIAFQNNIIAALKVSMLPTGGGANNCATSFYSKPNKAAQIWPTCYPGVSPFTGNVLVNYPATVNDWPTANLFSPSWPAVGFDSFLGGVYSLPQESPYVGKGANTDLVNLSTFGVALVTEAITRKP